MEDRSVKQFLCEESCVTKMMCDKVVCKRLCVCVSVMVCNKYVCVWKMVHDKVACDQVVCVRKMACVCVRDKVVSDKDVCVCDTSEQT